MHACIVVPGSIFIGFVVGQGALQHEKQCKFIVLSFKIKGLLNNMKSMSWRSQDSFFHGFVTTLGGIEELLDDIVASLLEVGFSMDFEEDPGLRHRGPERVNPRFLAALTNSWETFQTTSET